ncbi:MAG: tRNA (adenosine(37)-N6)-threonylcarbamoyltransferase complex transferase subunit TsaD [Candidatus Nealsonbacteria bacterium CG08_land_8_20_14_0_20_38_20]|uniref:tRNA N6-adenosine threonylcarbamoyltransferase n=1 Tax=Candidatus Nealsonbacteria bacterium CG08_land_8_20_14_0_20_38_20 TaxID=1974705 RepID=A0A2H0YM73_9BACT|nr:MAG: tRNA (adenosine(37)-N6)-threonylcarbamoyltransferase complex transferase subunit TsaD [Candidatus Nealsonbacteria bacterium CG08_land_8_20_14_0_20_38_20]
MKILAIDTSCDDTCVAVLEIENWKLEIKSNIVSSQVKIHQKYGGVYPTLAKREHQRNLIPVLKKALKEANFLNPKSQVPNPKKILNQSTKQDFVLGRAHIFMCSGSKFQTLKKILEREEYLGEELEKFLKKYQKSKVDAIAVTIGPGLEPCLWVGLNFAKALSYFWNLPIIPVNHIEAHILANWLMPVGSKYQIPNSKKLFPAVCLVVSGGHTQLILMRDIGKYKILGETRDDAAGECFDKTARILGLGYPGGPAIAVEAAKLVEVRPPRARGGLTSVKLPRPMINSKDYDFSFSGLKTAVLYKIKDSRLKIKDKNYIRAMCAEVQQAIIDVLIKKTIKTTKNYKAKTVILGGGVTANDELRKQFKEKIKKELPNFQYLIPNIQFCTDNAAMVAVAAYFHWLRGETKNWEEIEANANLRLN